MPLPKATPKSTTHIPLTHAPDHTLAIDHSRRHRRKAKADYLRHAMERSGHTMTSLAAHTGVDLSYISRIIGGWRTPSLDTTMRIQDALGLDLRELAEVLVGGAYHLHARTKTGTLRQVGGPNA